MTRCINGIVSSLLIVVFVGHEISGGFLLHEPWFVSALWLVWAGVGIGIVHILLSVKMTQEMFCDKVRPPSAKKKAHQVKKWITGVILGALVAVHIVVRGDMASWIVIVVLLVIALAVHLCISSKSLVKDLGLSTKCRFIFRVVVIVLAACVVFGVLVNTNPNWL